MSIEGLRTALFHPEEPPMTKDQFDSKFPEEAAIDYFVKIRYPDGLFCPHCGATSRVYHCNNRPKVCHCKNCNSNFSVFKGTIFEKSSTKLLYWFDAIRMFLNTRKGISSLQLQRELGVTPKTAWRMDMGTTRVLKSKNLTLLPEHIMAPVNGSSAASKHCQSSSYP